MQEIISTFFTKKKMIKKEGDIIQGVSIASSNQINSASVSKLTSQDKHYRQATGLLVVPALVLSGL